MNHYETCVYSLIFLQRGCYCLLVGWKALRDMTHRLFLGNTKYAVILYVYLINFMLLYRMHLYISQNLKMVISVLLNIMIG